MEMPKPGDAHKKLAVLVGEWIGEETLHPAPWDPVGGPAVARVTNRWAADGFAVHQDYEQTRHGKVTFRGCGVFWFDPARTQYVMHWWDSMGGAAGEYRGEFSGDRLELVSPMPQGGQSRTSWTLKGRNAHEFLMEVSIDGETWHPAMEGRYRRAGLPAKSNATVAAKSRVLKGARARTATRVGAPAKASGRSTTAARTRRSGDRQNGKAGPGRRR